jgi:hypothetical protein
MKALPTGSFSGDWKFSGGFQQEYPGMMSTTISTEEVVNAVAVEMASAVDCAVESWMAQIEHAFTDPSLTTLGRVHAVKEVLETYKRITGRTQLKCRRI